MKEVERLVSGIVRKKLLRSGTFKVRGLLG